MRGIRLKHWKTKPILRLRTMRLAPLVEPAHVDAVEQVAAAGGASRQPMMFISVDLPEPDAPMTAT